MMSSKLSKRQRKFVDNIADGLNPGQAALKAGYSDRDYGYALQRQPKIQTALVQAMEKAGVNDTMLADKIKDGLNAMTVPKYKGQERVDDQFVRKQFVDLALKVRGDYAPEKHEHIEKSVHIQLDGDLIRALIDARAIDINEAVKYIEHEPVLDAEAIDVGSDCEVGKRLPEGKDGTGEKNDGDVCKDGESKPEGSQGGLQERI